MAGMTSKAWYFVAGGLLLAAVMMGLLGVTQFISTVEGMHRVAMPGKAEVVLPVGPTTLYVESRSIIDGKAYQAEEGLSFRCAVTDQAGAAIQLEPSSSSVSYGIGDHAGRNAFDVRIETAGTYTLACEAPGPFVLAIGRGVGTWIVVALVGALVPGLLGVITLIIVVVLRSSQKRRAAALARP
jgi:hypothetical protein